MDNKKLFLSLIILTFILIIVISKLFLNNDNKVLTTSDIECRLHGPVAADSSALVEYLRLFYLTPPSTKSYNLSTNNEYNKLKVQYSWRFIHKNIMDLFSSQTNGIFFEAGAQDGEFLSNTLWLERNLNWTGILVEPDTKNFQELLYKNRKAWASNTCISIEKFPRKTIFVSTGASNKNQNYWALRALSHEGRSYTVNDPTVRSLEIDHFEKFISKTYSKIQCFPFHTYLLALNISVIDFLSLDLEGSEHYVLKQLPIEGIIIRAMTIEDRRNNIFNFDLVERMESKGYALYDVAGEPDYIFILKNDPFFMKLVIHPVDYLYNRSLSYFEKLRKLHSIMDK